MRASKTKEARRKRRTRLSHHHSGLCEGQIIATTGEGLGPAADALRGDTTTVYDLLKKGYDFMRKTTVRAYEPR
jgi:hypothetical protein